MKRLILISIGILFFAGCSTKVIVKKDNSIYQQKQDANKAWRNLDKEN